MGGSREPRVGEDLLSCSADTAEVVEMSERTCGRDLQGTQVIHALSMSNRFSPLAEPKQELREQGEEENSRASWNGPPHVQDSLEFTEEDMVEIGGTVYQEHNPSPLEGLVATTPSKTKEEPSQGGMENPMNPISYSMSEILKSLAVEIEEGFERSSSNQHEIRELCVSLREKIDDLAALTAALEEEVGSLRMELKKNKKDI
ncbi:hypothetical protein NDU88_002266 [Pleurodeles waltl]|uniref:Uncharacterized protein n=1 Tax=Pleurodeles waltl TaxID=8319 RepID=A0AAV7T1L5_PLEWA|nr:hypothetical protein NDU88_002266 [Pleurodeles waltl]